MTPPLPQKPELLIQFLDTLAASLRDHPGAQVRVVCAHGKHVSFCGADLLQNLSAVRLLADDGLAYRALLSSLKRIDRDIKS